ncbi:hypothetical protein J5N97_011386 [Dioscorea zingiberensis]|uniref:Uncharacterized protein n=1 Tax=Dioscorea zingiberensis TaxID=325984 RepID=A0A9D5HNN8_9LILI|nr:hypothetical protein J5N97_011386 [Dioscorea zingiberensis]
MGEYGRRQSDEGVDHIEGSIGPRGGLRVARQDFMRTASDTHGISRPRSQKGAEAMSVEGATWGIMTSLRTLAPDPTARNVSKEHMAKSGEAPHIFSQKSLQEGSRSITPKEPHIKHLNNASSSNEEVNDVNENLPHSIAIYSKPETTTKRDNEVEGDSDEIYLDPDFEKQIELEFQSLWNPQSEVEGKGDNNPEEQCYQQSKGDPGENIFKSTTIGKVDRNTTDPRSPSPQSLRNQYEGDSRPTTQKENPASGTKPNKTMETPSRDKGKAIKIPRPHPNIDLSKYAWRILHGSWTFMENTAWESMNASTDPTVQGNQEEGVVVATGNHSVMILD